VAGYDFSRRLVASTIFQMRAFGKFWPVDARRRPVNGSTACHYIEDDHEPGGGVSLLSMTGRYD
jgi:hypothetical protein